MKFLFKIKLFGPYLFKKEKIFENFQILDLQDFITKNWVKKVDGLNTSPSGKLCGISLNIVKEIKGGLELIGVLDKETNSIREAQRDIEIKLDRLVAILSILFKGSNYFYEITESTIESQSIKSNVEEIEGPPSNYLRNLNYSIEQIDDSKIPIINNLLTLVENQPEILKAVNYFISGNDSELHSGKGDEKTLINYFKIIEHVSNLVNKDIKISIEDKIKKYSELIEKLLLNFSKSKDIEEKIKNFKDSAYELRTIDNSVMKEKIIRTAKDFGLKNSELKDVYEVVDNRNKILAHSGEDFLLDEEKSLMFKEIAKIFIKKYLIKRSNIDFSYFDSLPEAKLFGNRQGYMVTAKYLVEHFQ